MFSALRNWRRIRDERNSVKQIIESGLFDPGFYLATYPDVAVSGADPALHFVRHGARESRMPSRLFDVDEYYRLNPDARRSGLNPIIDWLKFGKNNGRNLPNAGTPSGTEATTERAPTPAAVERDRNLDEIKRQATALGLFDEFYYNTCYTDVFKSKMDPFLHYFHHGGIENRNPSAEFDSQFYQVQHRGSLSAGENPLGHYIQHGLSQGLEVRPQNSITLSDDTVETPSSRIAIHIHLFYPEMVELFAGYISNLKFNLDLYVSTCSEVDAVFVERTLRRLLPDKTVVVRNSPNRGRDLAPFLFAFPEIWENYDFVLHLHSKKSPHTHFGQRWLDWVLRHLLGSSAYVQAAINCMERDPDIAMLFPDNYFEIKKFASWNGNETRTDSLLARLGVEANLPTYAHFAAGSMAWFRVASFRSLVQELSLDDFETENGQEEGTLAHTLERVLPAYAVATGQKISTFYLRRPPTSRDVTITHSAGAASEPFELRWMRDTPAIARWGSKPLSPLSSIYNPSGLEISWIIPDFGLGAGGHMTIFRMVEQLDTFGHRQTLWIQNPRNYPSGAKALKTIREHYRKVGDKVAVRFLPDDVRQLSGDAVIATDCWTVFPAIAATNFKERFYFIQDYEPYFHPVGSNHLIAESTYRFGLSALCAGEWLLRKAEQHGMWARKWELASDPEYYFPGAERVKKPADARYRIVFYCRGYTPRRATDLAMAGLEELWRRRHDFEVLMFGEAPQGKQCNFAHTELGILPPQNLGTLYRGADIGVVFSTTNYSLIPLEMMACNLPVVEIDTESTRIAFPEGSATLALPNPSSVADAIEKLLDDEVLRDKQVKIGRAFVADLSWEESARAVESAIRDRLSEAGWSPVDPVALTAPALGGRRKASVVIPTYNGGKTFEDVLTRVVAQKCDFDFDVLVVDSASTDGTAEFVKSIGDKVRLHEIDKKDFQHGRTRNLGISLTDGECVAILTQDATPADDSWLAKLIGGFDYGERIAGVIGRHRAYADHNPLVARDLDRMFDRMSDLGPVFDLDRGLPSFFARGSVDWRMLLHFYSDNNSAMRRSVWERLPYPEVDWGEDQIWAWEALKVGFRKAYVDDAVVFHSHQFSKSQDLSVGASEGRLFAGHFGYRLFGAGNDEQAFAARENAERVSATRHGLSQAVVDSYLKSARAVSEGRMLGERSVSE